MARSFKRKKPAKDPRQAFCILVEGQTELDYFEGLRARAGIPKSLVSVRVAHGTSVGNIKHELDRLRSGKVRLAGPIAFDQFWGVADTEWMKEWRAIATRPLPDSDNSKSSQKRAILWALSSSSFERWLLLHFENNPPSLDARASANRVGRFLKGYSADNKRLSDEQLNQLFDLTQIALANAQTWRRTGQTEQNFTDVDLLVRALLENATL